MTALRLTRNDTAALDHTTAFVPHDGDALETAFGVANFWLNFSAPCEVCLLKVQLCYDGSAGADCLTPKDNAAAAVLPLAGRRERITKPFTVAPLRPTHAVVTRQDVDGAGAARVGGALALEVLLAKVTAGWVFGAAGTAAVALHIRRARPAGGAEYHTVQKYAYGGFLGKGAAGEGPTPCGVPSPAAVAGDADVRWGAAYEFTASVASAPAPLAFHFTRPCEGCEVWLHPTVLAAPGYAGAPFVLPAFPLRHAAYAPTGGDAEPVALGDVLRLTVRTCGVKWQTAPPTTRVVYSRHPFTVPLLETDAAGFPVHEEGVHAAWADVYNLPAEVGDDEEFQVDAVDGEGNGGGGALLRWDHALDAGVRGAEFARGVMLPTYAFTHACYRCRVGFMRGGAALDLFVASEFARFILVPEVVGVANIGRAEAHTPDLVRDARVNVYAADAFGDRAYTFGGLSALRWRRPYQPLVVIQEATVALAEQPAISAEAAFLDENGTLHAQVVTAQGGQTDAFQAGVFYIRDGVMLDPRYENETLRLRFGDGAPVGTPVYKVAVGTQNSSADADAAGGGDGLKTFPVDMFSPHAVVVAAPATGLIVSVPDTSRGAVAATHHVWMTVEVRAVGTIGTETFLTTLGDGAVWVEPCFGYFGADGLGEQNAVPMQNGTASLPIRFYSGSGVCEMEVRHAAYHMAPLVMNVSEPVAAFFKWSSSASLNVEEADKDGGVASGTVLAGLTAVRVELMVVDAALRRHAFYRLRKLERLGMVVDPPGCFAVANNGAPDVMSGVVSFVGNFSAAVMTGGAACDFVNLTGVVDGAVTLRAPLRVTALRSAGLFVIPYATPFGERDYSGDGVGFGKAAWARRGGEASAGFGYHTGEGDEALALGQAATLTLGVFDADGSLVTADRSSSVRVSSQALRPGAPAAFAIDEVLTVQGGIAQLTFVPAATTALAGAEYDAQANMTHSPLLLSATLSNALVSPPVSFALEPPSPLYVIVVATRLRGRLLWDRAGPEGEGGAWMDVVDGGYFLAAAGQDFDLQVQAVDGAGNVALLREDVGSDAVATVSRVEVPCRAQGAATPPTACAVLDPAINTTVAAWQRFPDLVCRTAPPVDAWDVCQSAVWRVARGAYALPAPLALARGSAVMRSLGVAAAAPWETLRVVADGLKGFTVSFRFQEAAALHLGGADGLCKASFCRFPDAQFEKGPHTGVVTQEMLQNATMEELGFDQALPRQYVRDAFDLEVVLVDARGAPVHSNLSVATLFARCPSRPARDDALLGQWDAAAQEVDYGNFSAFAGVGSGAVGRVARSQRVIVRPLRAGRAVFERLAFAEICVDAVFEAACVMPAHLDPTGACNGKALVTEALDVMRPRVLVPTPVPARSNDYPVVGVKVGYAVHDFEELREWHDVHELEALLADALGPREACRVGNSSDDLNTFLKSDTCDGKVDQGCQCRLIGLAADAWPTAAPSPPPTPPSANPVTVADVELQWVCLLTTGEAEVRELDQLKTQFARCRQRGALVDPLSVLDPEHRRARGLDAVVEYHPYLEVGIKVGTRGDPQSGAYVAAQAALAFSDRDTDMYSALHLYASAQWASDVSVVDYVPTAATGAPTSLPPQGHNRTNNRTNTTDTNRTATAGEASATASLPEAARRSPPMCVVLAAVLVLGIVL
eukprot:TRINITY_DN14992_c0_g1_i1.p1 TRINITY_DN14992_c0_g1~~TRINITY_DN14992_c0_g1_i1.p1  ORF type:complete len:1661 (+),score=561.71 TRINITY_DN14992_c0_g1_i1:3-4985(+)